MKALSLTLEDGTPVEPHAGMQMRPPAKGNRHKLFDSEGRLILIQGGEYLTHASWHFPSRFLVNNQEVDAFRMMCLMIGWGASLEVHQVLTGGAPRYYWEFREKEEAVADND